MSEILNKFKISSKISDQLKSKIIKFWVFNKGKDIIFITNDDKVYGLGSNEDGILGFGHNRSVMEVLEIEELSEKKIIEIENCCGTNGYALALTDDGLIYAWGKHNYGQLGRDDRKEFGEPQVLEFFRDNKGFQISSGKNVQLVITEDSKIYQINDSGKVEGVEIEDDIMVIYSAIINCYALSLNGLVYSWGIVVDANKVKQSYNKSVNNHSSHDINNDSKNSSNRNSRSFGKWRERRCFSGKKYYYYNYKTHVSQWEKPKEWVEAERRNSTKFDRHSSHSFRDNRDKGCDDDDNVRVPRLIEGLPKVKKIAPGGLNVYFLTEEGHIYYCGQHQDSVFGDVKQFIPALIDHGDVFTDIYSNGIEVCALRDQDVFYFDYLDGNRLTKSIYHTFLDYYVNSQMSGQQFNKVDVKVELDILNNSKAKSEISQAFSILSFDGLFVGRFETLSLLGSGGFGNGVKVKDRFDDEIYAIKQVYFTKPNDDLKYIWNEVKTLAKVKGDRVVRYMTSWVENNHCLYIQMECCSDNLKNIIANKPNVFGRQSSEPMSEFEYYITSELFSELIGCVQYLHEHNPPIIHRDLKPHNVLMDDNPRNGHFLKLCDFGLAKVQDIESMYHTKEVGTIKYMAPEIQNTGKYDFRVDIYSLAIIAQDLFEYDINDSRPKTMLTNQLKNKFKEVEEMIILMITPFFKRRPSCADLLDKKSKWGLGFKDFAGGKPILSKLDFGNSSSLQSYVEFKFKK